MVAGHTRRDTINDRRPLTPGMWSLLKRLDRNCGIAWGDCSNGEKNQLRGLMDRGYAEPDEDSMWSATEEGREAVAPVRPQ